MRILLIIFAVVAVLSATTNAGASTVCDYRAAGEAPPSTGPDWQVDHYVRSSSGKREWAVMVDCNHPSAPEQMRLVSVERGNMRQTANAVSARQASAQPSATPQTEPSAVIRYGSPVVVVNAPNAAMAMRLTGVAEGTASAGQMIRVRLTVFHALINGIVRGPNTVELVGAVASQGRRP